MLYVPSKEKRMSFSEFVKATVSKLNSNESIESNESLKHPLLDKLGKTDSSVSLRLQNVKDTEEKLEVELHSLNKIESKAIELAESIQAKEEEIARRIPEIKSLQEKVEAKKNDLDSMSTADITHVISYLRSKKK